MQTAVAQPSAIPGAVVARAKPSPKRRRGKPAPKPAPVAPVIQPSPLALRVERVIRLGLASTLPFEHEAAVVRVRNQIAKLGLSITELHEIVTILAKIVRDGPDHQPPHEANRLSPEEASERTVPRYGVAQRVYWRAAYVGAEACISEGARRHLTDPGDILERLSLVLFWPGIVPSRERTAVTKRLSRDVARLIENRV